MKQSNNRFNFTTMENYFDSLAMAITIAPAVSWKVSWGEFK